MKISKPYFPAFNILFSTILISVICLGCSTDLSEPELPDTPQVGPSEPNNPNNGYPIFSWSDLAGKTFSGGGQFLDRYYLRLLDNASHPDAYVINYSRYSEHQYISISTASELYLHARLSSGWFNVQYLPGCMKMGSVAVPRIVPVQNDIFIDFEMKKIHKYGNIKAFSAQFSDTEGNGISGDLTIFKDGNFFGIERNFHMDGFDLNPDSDEIYEKIRFGSYKKRYELPTLLYERVNRIYNSFHGFKDKDLSRSFIGSDWKSDKFDSLAEGIITSSEFFSYITNLEYLDTEDYFSCDTKDKTISMDRVMATRFDEAHFYVNSGCVEISGRYETANKTNTIDYDRMAINFVHTPKENECMFFVNPEILLTGTTQIAILATYSQATRNAFLKNTSVDTDNVTFPMHTPKSYDWNAEMLLALSPYTANGLPMTYENTYEESGTQITDYLTFSFSDPEIAKKFVTAYFSPLEDQANIAKLKKCIREDESLEDNKKKVIMNIVDNLPDILDQATDFQISFHLIRIFDKDRIQWEWT